ncbi:hypothetical protein KR215_011359 [Drosophila sulfurigaster]|nr:hypothetical protein KR215_011359 [Drosophila sulfurigaster]
MSSKFWIFIALLSVGIAHTYVYTDFIKQVEAKENSVAGITEYVTSMWPHVDKIAVRIKNDLKSMLETGHLMAKIARKAISDYREKHKQELDKKNVGKTR